MNEQYTQHLLVRLVAHRVDDSSPARDSSRQLAGSARALVSNAPRVHASSIAPRLRPPLRHGSLSRRGLGRVRARGSSPLERARVPRAPVSRARVSRRGRRADRAIASRGSRDRPRRGAHRGDAPPRQVRPSGRVRAALARHPRPVPGVRRGIPQPLGRGRRARARPRRRGRRRGRDVRGARAPPSRRPTAGYPARATSRASARDGRSRPLHLALAAGGASRGRLRPRARRRARAQRRIRRARRAAIAPSTLLPARQRLQPRAPPRAPPPRAPARKSARVDDARARRDACRDEARRRRPRWPDASASRRRGGVGQNAVPSPSPRAPPRGSGPDDGRRGDAGVRAQTPIFAQRLWQTPSHVEAANARASVAFGFEMRARHRRGEVGRSHLGARAPPLPSSAYEVLLSRDADARACARGGDGGDDGGDPRGVRWHLAAPAAPSPARTLLTKTNDAKTKTTTKTNRRTRSDLKVGRQRSRSFARTSGMRFARWRRRRVARVPRSDPVDAGRGVADTRGRARDARGGGPRRGRNDSRNGPNAPRTARTFDTFREGGTSERCRSVRRGAGVRTARVGDRRRRVAAADRPRHPRRVPPSRIWRRRCSRADADARGRCEAALVARGATLRSCDEREARRVPDARPANGANLPRGTSPSFDRARAGSSPETPEDAAARLDELARASEAALARTRRRARAFLAAGRGGVRPGRIGGGPGARGVTGWSEDEPS